MNTENSQIKSLDAYEKIRNLILSGTKLPGTRLVIAELEQELNLGKGPIREALMRLDRSGLVKNIPYKGAIVAIPPKIKEMRYLYDLRVNIETKLAIEAMENLTDKDMCDLEAIIEKMKSQCESDDNFFTLDIMFHKRLYEASNLQHLCFIVQKLLESVEIFLNAYNYETTDCSNFIEQHIKIVESLKNKDIDSLTQTLERNILGGLELIDKEYKKILIDQNTSISINK